MDRRSVFIVLGALVGFNVLAWIGVWQLYQVGLEVTFFDVGQGDAIFIETPQHHQILIDGGPTQIILEKLGGEMPFWDRTIDFIVLTHPEKDHLTGLIEVLKRYRVQNILWTGVVRDTAEYREWQKVIQEEGANIYLAQSGQVIKCSRSSLEYCRIDILYPFESLEGKEMKDSNDSSVVVRLDFGENSFLFTGDASKSVERQLLNLIGQQLDSDVLKAGHHGSKNSSAEEFIGAVSPEIAVISAGKNNNYGHPSKETLDTLAGYGINVLRTDIGGDTKIYSDGNNFKY